MDKAVGLFLLFLIFLGGIVVVIGIFYCYRYVKEPNEMPGLIMSIPMKTVCESQKYPDRAEILCQVNMKYHNLFMDERKEKNRNKANESRQLNLQRFRKAPIFKDKQFCEIINEIEVD